MLDENYGRKVKFIKETMYVKSKEKELQEEQIIIRKGNYADQKKD